MLCAWQGTVFGRIIVMYERVSFENDYNVGAHPKVLERLFETNMERLSGYGSDFYCRRAAQRICDVCGLDEGDVFFLVGGTQTNSVVISSMLRDFEGVVSADTGHIAVHEAGAVEYTGKKVLTIPGVEGKLPPSALRRYLSDFFADENREHMVFPGMVYISHPTELGTLYTYNELSEISEICSEYGMPLFLDGARLGYGLMSRRTDVGIKDIARLCDVFYIGGTKVGALCGEAVVFTKNNKPPHFENFAKRRGALLAKGRLVGVQFDALFDGGLYFEIGRAAIDAAEKMKDVLKKKKCRYYIDSPTNQQFVIIENKRLERLKSAVDISIWQKYDEDNTVIRLVTSWATTEKDIEALERAL